MDRWMDGWMDGMDGRIDRWIDMLHEWMEWMALWRQPPVVVIFAHD
jgi:hypothetical protein